MEDGDTRIAHHAYGVGAVQALLPALTMAQADLVAHARAAGGGLQWLGLEDLGLGR